MSHPTGDIHGFASAYAQAHGLTDQEVGRLVQKTRAIEAWEKQLIRVVGSLKTYAITHPTPQRGLSELRTSAKEMIKAYGPLTLEIGPSFVMTEEGYVISRGGGDRRYGFLPLFRDGVRRLTLLAAERAELELLLEVLSNGGSREGDDAVTWLWSGRLKGLRIEVAPWYPPRVAAALHLAEPGDHVFSAYVKTLLAAGAHVRPKDRRPPLDRTKLHRLANRGLDHAQIISFLSGGALDDRFTPPAEEVKEQCRLLFADHTELRRRARLIRMRFSR